MKSIIKTYCYLFFYFGCLMHVIGGTKPIELSDSIDQIGVRKDYAGILEDKNNIFTIEQLTHETWSDSFLVVSKQLPTNKNKSSAYWLKFEIIDYSSNEKKWLLEFFDHTINEITLYAIDSLGNPIARTSGNKFPFFERAYYHKNIEFSLPLNKGKKNLFYVKIRSRNNNVIIPEIRSYKKFIAYSLTEYYLLGAFYGILGIFFIYSFLLFVIVQKRRYLYYSMYILSVMIYSMTYTGLGFQYIWPGYPAINDFITEISIFTTILFSILLAKNFLGLGSNEPKLNKYINLSLYFRIAILVIGISIYPPFLKYIFLDLVPISVMFIAGFVYIRKTGNNPRYFSIAYSLLFLTFIITVLEHYGIIFSGILTVYSLHLAIIADIVLFSISFAVLIKKEIRKKESIQIAMIQSLEENKRLSEKVNLELEEKVQQRTKELHMANEKLQKQADEITKINLSLDILNSNLRKDVTEISQKRIIKPKVEYTEFLQAYSNESACYRFLDEMKSGKDFVCKKCSSPKYGKGKDVFDRRCTRCGYNESITANTLFHKLKFPIVKAFYMTHLIFTKRSITAEELSKIVEIRKETCSVFKKKVLDRIRSADVKNLESWDVIVLDDNFKTAEKHE